MEGLGSAAVPGMDTLYDTWSRTSHSSLQTENHRHGSCQESTGHLFMTHFYVLHYFCAYSCIIH